MLQAQLECEEAWTKWQQKENEGWCCIWWWPWRSQQKRASEVILPIANVSTECGVWSRAKVICLLSEMPNVSLSYLFWQNMKQCVWPPRPREMGSASIRTANTYSRDLYRIARIICSGTLACAPHCFRLQSKNSPRKMFIITLRVVFYTCEQSLLTK